MRYYEWNFTRTIVSGDWINNWSAKDFLFIAHRNGKNDILSQQLARYVRNVCQRWANARGGTRSRRVAATFSGFTHESAHGSRVEQTTSPCQGSFFSILHLLRARATKRIARGPPIIHHPEKRVTTRSTWNSFNTIIL